MRVLSISVFIGICLGAASAVLAQQPSPVDVTGTWTFTWDNNSKNVNQATLKQDTGTIAGTYINDSKEKCPIAGRFEADGSGVVLTIVCPHWEIKSNGQIRNSKLIEGRYTAYGSSSGDFRMSRQ